MSMAMIQGILLGLVLGPPLNALIDQLPRSLKIVVPSTCATCNGHRPNRSMLPIAGWLLARGRCEHCRASVSPRVPLIELALPLVGWLLWLRDGNTFDILLHLILVAYLIAIVAIDLEHRLVLNRMTGAGALAALGIAAAGFGPSLTSAVAGASVGFLILLLPALLLPGIGMGDVKLAGVIGALVGFPAVFTALQLGVVFGGIAAGLLLFSRRIGRGATIAYAPYLVAGVALVFFGVVGQGSP